MLKSHAFRWGSLAKTFHWLILLLILAQAVIGLTMVNLPKRPSVFAIYNLHKSIGLTILALALLRLAWRIVDRRPLPTPGMPSWQRRAAHATHVLLYMLIFAVPLSGWLFDSATGLRPLHWWGVLHMPSLTGGPAREWAGFARALHHWMFWTMVVVVLGHVAAALKHHCIDRDDTLRRMLPFARVHESGDPAP